MLIIYRYKFYNLIMNQMKTELETGNNFDIKFDEDNSNQEKKITLDEPVSTTLVILSFNLEKRSIDDRHQITLCHDSIVEING